MKIIKINTARINKAKINQVTKIVKSGGVIIFPTDTVYGLGCQYGNQKAMERIYQLKKRSENKPLPVLLASIKEVRKLIKNISRPAQLLMDKFWPGPLTIIVRAEAELKLGLRIPSNKIALAILKSTGVLYATSANISQQPSAVTIEDIPDELAQKVDLIIDGGKCNLGVESTVIDISSDSLRLVREGYIKKAEILKVAGENV